MKIAVVQAGQLRLSDDILRLSDNILKNLFPNADFFYPVWQEEYDSRKDIVEKISKNSVVEVIKEYDIDYHPFDDNPKILPQCTTKTWRRYFQTVAKAKAAGGRANWQIKARHRTKQILNHNIMVKKYLQDYDVIIKTRYDIFARPYQDWDHVLNIVNEGAVVSAYGTTVLRKFYDAYGEMVHNPFQIIDAGFVIHKSNHWDCDRVEKLNKDRKLLAGEMGWYQALLHNNPWPYYKFRGGTFFTKKMLPEMCNE